MKSAKKYVMTPYDEAKDKGTADHDSNNKDNEDNYPGLDDVQFGGNTFFGSPEALAPLASSAAGAAQGRAQTQEAQGAQVTQDSKAAGSKKKGNAIRERALDKASKSAKIISRLARVNGYNDAFEIKLRNGKYLDGSNLIVLLWHVLTPAREVQGLKEFTELLSDAGVLSDWIDNPNVRSSLAAMNGPARPPVSASNDRPALVNPVMVSSSAPRRYVSKRRGDDDDPQSVEAPKLKRRRLEDELTRIRTMQSANAPSPTPFVVDETVHQPEARPAKRSREPEPADYDAQDTYDVDDIEEGLETQELVPTVPVPPLHSQVLRARKQKLARKLRRPGTKSSNWSDSDSDG